MPYLARAKRIIAIAVAIALAVTANLPAGASFHIMAVSEVFAGTPEDPDAQFIELRMYTDHQRFVNGQKVSVYDAGAQRVGQFTFLADVSNGANQSAILIATSETQILFGVTPDLLMDSVIPSSGGKVCFETSGGGEIDCVSWGNYPAGGSTGTPFNLATGLDPRASAERRIDRGNPALLDFSDDTNNSAVDFRAFGPTPTNNGGTTGSHSSRTGFSQTDYQVEESAGTASVTVTRSDPGSGTSVDYTTQDGTALDGADYTATSGTIDFGPGQATASFGIPILVDASDEFDEKFNLVLFNLTAGVYERLSATVTIIGSIRPPSAPQNVIGQVGPASDQITLDWSQPATDNGDSIDNYRVFGGTHPSNMQLLATLSPSTLSYVQSGLAGGVTYYYAVSATNAAGEGPQSQPISVTLPPNRPPSAPRSAQAVPGPGLGQTTVFWQGPSQPNAPFDTLTYHVYRKIEVAGTWSEVAAPPWYYPQYVDDDCRVTTVLCFYRVTASNAAGEGPPSNEVVMAGTRVG